VFDLMSDPEPLLSLNAEEISDRLFTSASDLPEGVERIQLKAIHSNHVPMIAPQATLKGVDCERIGLDLQRCNKNAEKLLQVLPLVRNKVMDVFKPYQPGDEQNPDHMIYSGGFFSSADRQLMDTIRHTKPASLSRQEWPFKDQRLVEMLFRYRARNYPTTLDSDELVRWQSERLQRLQQPSDNKQLNPEGFLQHLADERIARQGDNHAQKILDQLEAWADQLLMPNSL
jgi:exodeoxyribonuclease-1